MSLLVVVALLAGPLTEPLMVSTATAPKNNVSLRVEAEDSIFPFDGQTGTYADVHDPSIVEFNGTYLLFHTSGHEFCALRTSKDLKTWKEWSSITTPPAWLKEAVPQHRSVWAPAPIKVGKALRVYYCASQQFGSNTSFIGMTENPNFNPEKPLEGWQDRGKLIESKAGTDNFNAIDPDVFIDQKGRHWMPYGSYWSGLYMVELDPKTGLRLNSNPPIHIASNTGERGNPLEAPYLAYHDGYYYLFVVYGLAAQGVRSTYRMMVGRSKSMNKPFLGFDGKPMTDGGHTALLKSSPPMYAPGGGNIFRDKDGSLKLAYHFYDGRKYWHKDMWGRPVMQVRDIVWGKDGWPLPGLPVGSELARTNGKIAGTWIHQADFGDAANIELTSDGKIKSGERTGTWEQKGDQLTFTWPASGRTQEAFEDKLQLAYDGRYYVGRNRAGAVIRGIRRDAAKR